MVQKHTDMACEEMKNNYGGDLNMFNKIMKGADKPIILKQRHITMAVCGYKIHCIKPIRSNADNNLFTNFIKRVMGNNITIDILIVVLQYIDEVKTTKKINIIFVSRDPSTTQIDWLCKDVAEMFKLSAASMNINWMKLLKMKMYSCYFEYNTPEGFEYRLGSFIRSVTRFVIVGALRIKSLLRSMRSTHPGIGRKQETMDVYHVGACEWMSLVEYMDHINILKQLRYRNMIFAEDILGKPLTINLQQTYTNRYVQFVFNKAVLM